jgi:AcrR family transcriptional regulator
LRNKYPEKTKEQILSVSAKLFLEKGYDKTSIQDIIDALGMSKGAIYHHFKSKEEILDGVMELRSKSAIEIFNDSINNTKAGNAREKLITILESTVADEGVHTMDNVLRSQIKNPQLIVTSIKDSILSSAPKIAAIMLEGKEDGSITADYIDECAEIFMLLLNIWINPVIFDRRLSEIVSRLKTLQQIMKQLGADVVSDKLIQRVAEVYSKYLSKGGCK